MNDCMMFPDDWREFLKSYSFKDTEELYTNGSELIPVFRVEQLIEHLLAKQEPRVLTLEEVESSDGSVWLERNMPEWETPIAVLVDKVGKYLDTFIAIGGLCFQGEKSQGQEYGDYGKTWRCWSARPTDEQREAVPWDT